jgi:hypothetical protein
VSKTTIGNGEEVEMSENETETTSVVSDAMTVTISDLFATVFGNEWMTMELSDAIAFRNLLEAFVTGANMLREKFDGAVWQGHSDGTVSVEIQSVRKQRTGDTPGRKAKELTPAELLAKRLTK